MHKLVINENVLLAWGIELTQIDDVLVVINKAINSTEIENTEGAIKHFLQCEGYLSHI